MIPSERDLLQDRRRLTVKTVAQSFWRQGMLTYGDFAPINEVVMAVEDIEPGHASTLLPLTLLALQTVEAHDGA